METSTPDVSDALIELRGKRSSSVILHRIAPDRVNEFLEWERGITAAVKAFPGYQSTDVYPPADLTQQQWVVVVHFDDPASLKRWVDSPERAEWTAREKTGIGDFQMKTLPDGFGGWFAGLVDTLPASWQIATTVVLGLYPTVMVLAYIDTPYLSPLGMSLAMLIGNILSVSFLQWILMPQLEKLLRPWLHPVGPKKKAIQAGGFAIIVCVLALMVIGFRQLMG